MPRLDAIIKALQLLRLLEGRRVRPTAVEVAAELGVSERTARRYFAACHAVGMPMPPTVHDCRYEEGR